LIKVPLTFADKSSSAPGEIVMSNLNRWTFAEKSQPVSNEAHVFDRNVAASIGRCIKLRRALCGLSKEQLGARLGIDVTEVEAYEQGGKRISAKLLLETAKHLRARPAIFFQGQDIYANFERT
jgi:ribosome-binding protein aMBF1 (putative translation factor)